MSNGFFMNIYSGHLGFAGLLPQQLPYIQQSGEPAAGSPD